MSIHLAAPAAPGRRRRGRRRARCWPPAAGPPSSERPTRRPGGGGAAYQISTTTPDAGRRHRLLHLVAVRRAARRSPSRTPSTTRRTPCSPTSARACCAGTRTCRSLPVSPRRSTNPTRRPGSTRSATASPSTTAAPLTADDVVASLQHAPRTRRSARYWASVYRNVKSIEKTGDMEVTVTLTKPDSMFNQYMAVTPGHHRVRGPLAQGRRRLRQPEHGRQLHRTRSVRLLDVRARASPSKRYDDYWDPT